VFILNDFKFSDFVSVDCRKVRRRFSGSVDCTGVGDAGLSKWPTAAMASECPREPLNKD
jgi:hypothetical protein